MPRHLLIFGLLLAAPILSGAKCTFFFSTGDSDPDPNDPNESVIQVMQGHFIGPPIRGVAYRSGSLAGVTGEHGEFHYEKGGTIQFYIGDIRLGREVKGNSSVSPIDLVEEGDDDNPVVINIARLLQSLDAIPDDDIITIPASIAREAVATNPALFSPIKSLDFGDSQSFANAASTLVAVLTRDYPFTATVIDGDAARERMLESVAAWKAQQATTAVKRK